MKISEIHWNDEARQKVLDDADRVLQDAVAAVAGTDDAADADKAYAALVSHMKDKFIDWEPGPDVRTYADALAAGEVELESRD
ncbi:hypothetical protein [Microbacterium arborescens]|uniref:hypothetical protein n=1 Tax=Microbacterium arborescens TaxID=33883 RepID=UPI003C778C9B